MAAMVEPLSIAVQAARRGRLAAGERAVIFGGGAIGQCIALVAQEWRFRIGGRLAGGPAGGRTIKRGRRIVVGDLLGAAARGCGSRA